ncbi:MAG: 2-oxoacid:acceptor oxidoreductase family protein [Anaerolineae bacterium]|jgi:indolepyruvate ferredoxin oxidoreductase beta subunit
MNETLRSRQHASGAKHYDIFLVGVGGQGILTIGDLIAETAMEAGLPVNFYPTKGMAQRGGSVRVQVRIGRQVVGPEMPERSADLVIAMERSEALKAVRYVRAGGDFVLYGHVWEPTRVMLGKADYPSLEQVREKVQDAGCRMHYLAPEELPTREGQHLPANIYVLGTALGHTTLGELLPLDEVARIVAHRWEKYAAMNRAALRAGLEAPLSTD